MKRMKSSVKFRVSCTGCLRTFPSPLASVDLSHISAAARGPPFEIPEPEAEGDHAPSSIVTTLGRRNTLKHLFGVAGPAMPRKNRREAKVCRVWPTTHIVRVFLWRSQPTTFMVLLLVWKPRELNKRPTGYHELKETRTPRLGLRFIVSPNPARNTRLETRYPVPGTRNSKLETRNCLRTSSRT